MSQPSGILALQMWISEPRKNSACYVAAIELPQWAAATPYGEGGTKDAKNQISGCWPPYSWDAYERNDFSDFWLNIRLLHLAYIEKHYIS